MKALSHHTQVQTTQTPSVTEIPPLINNGYQDAKMLSLGLINKYHEDLSS